MQLLQTSIYRPQSHSYFPHAKTPLLTLHASGRYLAFQTRSNQIILRDTTTGHTSVLLASQHPITSLCFTHQYLLVSQQSMREVLVYSLKGNQNKLKTRLTGHRGQITQIVYNRNLQLIASISHDQCLIHSEQSLSHLKTLKCSTSSFTNCGFSLSGSIFATSFKDGSILIWNPSKQWQYQANAVINDGSLKVAMGSQAVWVVYDQKKVWMVDSTKKTTSFWEIQQYWHNSKIVKVVIIAEVAVIVATQQALYLLQVNYSNKLQVQTVKKIQIIPSTLTTTQYQQILVILHKNTNTIQFLKVTTNKNTILKQQNNPLTNQGLVCAGGYGGKCQIQTGIQGTQNNYQEVQQQIQPLTKATYQDVQLQMGKLKVFLKKNHCLPDKYRAMAYRNVLQLPIDPQRFREFETKGQHFSVEVIERKYPIDNNVLKQRFKEIVGLLAHWEPVMGQADFVPPIVFPFVCLLGQDTFLCFQVLYRLFTGPLSFLFSNYPLANSSLLQNLFQILSHQDPQLIAHLNTHNISLVSLLWGLLSSFFSSVLTREHFLAVADNVIVKTEEPETVLFLALGYLQFNRKRILSCQEQSQARKIVQNQQTVHLGKWLALSSQLQSKYRSKLTYPLQQQSFTSKTTYEQLHIPRQAVQMHESKGRILYQQLLKHKQAQNQRQKMLKQMQKMTTKVRRQAQRQQMQEQAYILHCQQQENNQKIKLKQIDREARIQKLEQMVDQLNNALSGQLKSKQTLRRYVPAVQVVRAVSDPQLEALEERLMQTLGEVRPGNSLQHLASQPHNLLKGAKNSQGLKGAVNANLAATLWELDQLAKEKEQLTGQARTLGAMRH